MSHSDLLSSKKRKRGDRIFKFKSFTEQGYPIELLGVFRENVKALLELGHLETNLCDFKTKCWSFRLEVHRHPSAHTILYVVEESIDVSPNRHCKQCQYIGWGHHMICNKKYHFLLPSKDSIVIACKGDDSIGADSKSKLLEDSKRHIMHGVVHSNGFGHLLSLNGLETGSDLSGHQIIQFWDRLCTGLRVRKVSLNDSSQKLGMDLRLIHGVAYGQSWFGRWGYNFGRGTHCVTQQMYQKALEVLQNTPLSLLVHNHCYRDLNMIFSKYQSLSDHSLVTLRDLLNFMMELKLRLPKDSSNMESYNPGILVETTCRWSLKRVEMATRVILESLKRARFRWVSRQEVRDVARNYIGDTGLLDYVLKSLGNQIIGSYLVRRSLNPVTKVLEYCLEDLTNHVISDNNSNNINQEGNNNSIVNGSITKATYKITRLQLMKDMFYMYKYVLKENRITSFGVLSGISMAVRMVLDSKYLVKDFFMDPLPMKSEGKLSICCTILLTENEDTRKNSTNKHHSFMKKDFLQPYEYVTVENNTTIEELKLEIEKNFQDVYWGLKGFVGETIHNVRVDGVNLVHVNSLAEIGQKLVLVGNIKHYGHHVNQDMIMCDNNITLYEYGSSENLVCVIDCPCGSIEDDGERKVCCDICETWQHTLCVGIHDCDEVPHIFLCKRCEQQIMLLPDSLP